MNTTISEIYRILGLDFPENMANDVIDKLLTDSRSLIEPEGTLFFAISTPTTDASRFMRVLYDKGVRHFLSADVPDDMKDLTDVDIIIYPDPLAALQKIACRRGRTGGEVVAITGSKGKTTLKEMIYQLVSPLRNTVRSPRSYNSQIGVPLSMWEITMRTQLTLIEAGISKSGEMSRLAECIHPDTVIITGIDGEHDDGFSSREQKVAEKVSLAATPGVRRVIYCADDADVVAEVEKLPWSVERFSWSRGNTGRARVRIIDVTPLSKRNNGMVKVSYVADAELRSIEAFADSDNDLRNVFTAIAFMTSERVPVNTIAKNFRSVQPITTRMNVADGSNGCTVIYDSYMSDSSSLTPAVDFLMRRRTPGQQTVVIMSDMRCYGKKAKSEYVRVAEMMKARGVDLVLGVGPELKRYDSFFGRNARFFLTPLKLAENLQHNPLKNVCVLIKGSAEYDFTHITDLLEIRTHETVLEVNLDAMIHNYNYFRSQLPASTGMIAMVKAFGYGVGSYEIAKTLQDAGAAYLAVAVLDEGLDLRRQGITMPIMVMNPRVADYQQMFANNLEPEIYTRAMLDDVIAQAEKRAVTDYPIHIKLDTGMHRMGFLEEELPELMEAISKQDNVRISSVFTHLATADMPDMDDYTQFQLDNFERCSKYMLDHCSYGFRRHVLNSAGIMRYPQYHYDMVRLGIGLYGVNTLPRDMEKPLEVVSTLRTIIINVREYKAGTTVGYGRRGLLERDSRIATIPIGYADGMNRRFGNGAIRVLVNGVEAPTVGNICMDACMIDVTGIDCREGDSVEIFGRKMKMERLSDLLDTIPYEILTSVSPRVKRVYYRE